jgi:hypothetical protein
MLRIDPSSCPVTLLSMLDFPGTRKIRSLVRLVPMAVVSIAVLSTCLYASGRGGVVINEIQFNAGKVSLNGDESQRERFEEEFIELHNAGDVTVNLKGWSFKRGIDYEFGNISLPGGSYLVVAADLDTFRRVHSGIDIENVVGPFAGRLSNTSERITLVDTSGNVIDDVHYADSGQWARRVTTKLRGYDHWQWQAPHDGEGMSLELIDTGRDNRFAHAWAASSSAGGSPGKPNTVSKQDSTPFIGEVLHEPAMPNSNQRVKVTAQLSVPVDANVRVNLRFRRDGSRRFGSSPMFDDGSHADGEAADHLWAGELPAQSHGTIIEFFVQAQVGDAIRQWPPLSSPSGGLREALCLYQVNDNFDPAALQQEGAQPVYHFIFPRREVALMQTINSRSSANSVYNNRFSGTWISLEPSGTEIRYLASARLRGNGSRGRMPPGLRVSFPSDGHWKGIADINMNSQFVQSQVLGAAIYQLMGFPSARSTPVYFRINGEDWTDSGTPQFGHYAHNEVLDGYYLEAHFPRESDGNLYRGINQANLDNRGEQTSRYRTLYSKRNNGAQDDYSDIIALVKTLDRQSDRTVSDDQYLEEVKQIMDVDQWLRYFALDALVCNLEGGLPTGRGDDYAMFRGKDGRFRLVPYDLDSILGMGERSEDLTKSIFDYGDTRGLRRLFQHPAIIRSYLGHIRGFLDGPYRPEVLNLLIDEVLGSWVPSSELDKIKAFIPKRIAVVKSQIEGYTIVGSTLEMAGDFHRTTRPDFVLYGRFDPSEFRSVRVNGRTPKINLRAGTWMFRANVEEPLVTPGINPVTVEMLDEAGIAGDRATMQVWYDSGRSTEVTGTLAGKTEWKAASGPYLVKGELVVPKGAALTIEAGTTVFFEQDASVMVQGELSAIGNEARPIRFAAPVSLDEDKDKVTWKGIAIQGGKATLEHAGLDSADHEDGALRISDAPVTMSHVAFGHTSHHWITASDGILDIKGCKFADSGGFVRATGGIVSIASSEFGFAEAGEGITLVGPATGIARIAKNTFEGARGCVLNQSQLRSYVIENLFGSKGKDNEAAIEMRGSHDSIVAGNGFLGWKHAMKDANIKQTRWSVAFEKNTLRFSSGVPLLTWMNLPLVGNIVAGEELPFSFKLPDSAWVAKGKPTDWAMLEPAQMPALVGAHASLLSVQGVPPTGVSGESTRRIRFRYPGGKEASVPWEQSAFTGGYAEVGVAGEVSSLDLEITDITGTKIFFAKAASWKRVPGHIDLMISEVLAANGAAYKGRNGTPDAVELFNYGSKPLDLHAFRLTDDATKVHKFVFPKGTIIEPGAYLVVDLGIKNPEDGALDAEFALSGSGESVLLIAPEDSGGNLIDRVTFGNQISGKSVGRFGGEWRLCEPSLGEVNRTAMVADPRGVRLSEWLAAGGNGTAQDFIELRNPSAVPVDVSGCSLTDNIAAEPRRHLFPPLSFLPAESVTAFFASGNKGAGNQLDFKLSEDGEVLGFLDSEGRRIDWVAYSTQIPGRSQGRDETGNLVSFRVPTPGSLHPTERLAAAEGLVRSLRISEVHYHPPSPGAEYLELANIGTETLDLSGVKVVEGVEFEFEEGSTLAPGHCLVLVAERSGFVEAYGEKINIGGEYSGKLSNGGENIRLESSGGVTIQEIGYSDKWYDETDGGNKALVAVDLKGSVIDWSKKRAWKAGEVTPGS